MWIAFAFAMVAAIAFAVLRARAPIFTQEGGKGAFALARDAVVDGGSGFAGDKGLDRGDDDARALRAAVMMVNRPDILRFKRGLDVVLSGALLMILSPLLLATAIAIKLDSPGPVIYRQKRVGFGGVLFDVLKFRSMDIDAENNGPQYASPDDGRVTRIGRVLRKFRIDEIPQAVNVLRGEMSFIGPRPERPEFVEELEREIPDYQYRHLVKPGITGWAQVKYEYAASLEGARQKLVYDLYYIRNFSPALDFVILILTVRVALFGLGSR